jgi:ribosomal subunit interface protein
MDVTVQGRNVDVSEQLRTTVVEKVGRLGRLLQGMDHAEVHLFEERNPRIADKQVCEVVLAGHGHLVRAKASAGDALGAVDQAVAKLEHQLAKLKGKLLGRSHPRRPGSVNSVKADEEDRLDRGDRGDRVDRGDVEDRADTQDTGDEGADDDLGGWRPTIVKTKQFAIKPMTPEEAALQMELLGHDFYFFTNADTERAAVVYRRNDGDVGLIDGS